MSFRNIPIKNEEKYSRRVESQAKMCVEITQAICKAVESGHPADRELAKILRSRKELGSRDRKLLSDLVFAFFRWKGWTEAWQRESFDKALLASLILDGKTDHDVARKWARKFELPDQWNSCLKDAKLDEKFVKLKHCLGSTDLKQSWKDLLPKWFYKELYVPSEFSSESQVEVFRMKMYALQQTRPPVWIRLIDSRKRQIINDLKRAGVDFTIDEELKNCASLHSPVNLHLLPAYKKGYFEVQDLSSQMVGHVCSPHLGEAWWDVCAGAGGKTLHLAELMKGRGTVFATDVRKSALLELQRRLKKCGTKNIIVRHSEEGKEWDGRRLFDGVLVDAPCSGTGVWRRNPDARWRMADDLTFFTTRQIELLIRIKESVRPGGVLVYSVCSITKSETEGVVEKFLSRSPEFNLSPFLDPLTKKSISGKIWIWPHKKDSDAMFIVRFQRNAKEI